MGTINEAAVEAALAAYAREIERIQAAYEADILDAEGKYQTARDRYRATIRAAKAASDRAWEAALVARDTAIREAL